MLLITLKLVDWIFSNWCSSTLSWSSPHFWPFSSSSHGCTYRRPKDALWKISRRSWSGANHVSLAIPNRILFAYCWEFSDRLLFVFSTHFFEALTSATWAVREFDSSMTFWSEFLVVTRLLGRIKFHAIHKNTFYYITLLELLNICDILRLSN